MQREEIMLPHGPGFERVPIHQIQYIESDKRLCKVVTATRSYTLYASIRGFEKLLSGSQFLRIHKRYIISMDYVQYIGKAEIKMEGRAFPVSRKAMVAMQAMFLQIRTKPQI